MGGSLAKIKIYQYKIKDAPEFAESAYRKFESLPLTDEQKIIKISVISTLADVYSKLKRNAAEIEKREQAVTESEKIFSDKTDENIIESKYKLAAAFKDAEKNNRALEIYEEIYNTLKPLNNERTIDAAAYYANALYHVGRYNDALQLREKIVDFYRETNDIENLRFELHNFRYVLERFSSQSISPYSYRRVHVASTLSPEGFSLLDTFLLKRKEVTSVHADIIKMI